MTERCDLTDLLVAECACREHRGGALPDVETVGQPFCAAYDGTCERCHDPIQPGQRIARVADPRPPVGYVHAGRCPA